MVLRSASWEGPLPPPAAIEAFAKIYPDAPRIIFESFEKEGEHRRKMEAEMVANQKFELETQRKAVDGENRQNTIAALTAAISLLGLFGGGLYLLGKGLSI